MDTTDYPEEVRKEVVEILKTGTVVKERIFQEHLMCYLEVCSISPPLKDVCQEILLETVNFENYIDVLAIADKFELLLLKKETINFIGNNFESLWPLESFKLLNDSLVEAICQSEQVCKSPDVFPALAKWLEFDHGNRFKPYMRLLQIIQYFRSPRRRSETIRPYTTYHAMMISKTKHLVETAVFNCDGDVVCHRNLFKSSDIKGSFSVTCVQKDEKDAPYVYFSSGKHVIRYDALLNTHNTCDSLVNARDECSLVSVGDFIYAVGGHHNGNSVRVIEELDSNHHKHTIPIKTSWKPVAMVPENVKLTFAPCVVVCDKIYIIGDKLTEDVPSTVVLVFNPRDKSVERIAEFPKKCSDSRAVLYESCIYIASSEGYFLKFDTGTNVFTSCCDIPTPSIHFGMYVERNKIYIVSASISDNGVDRFEKEEYDTETISWKSGKESTSSLPIYGSCEIKVPSYTNVIPFYDSPFTEIR